MSENFHWFNGLVLLDELAEPAKNGEIVPLSTRDWLVISQSWNWKICKICQTEQVLYFTAKVKKCKNWFLLLFIYLPWTNKVSHSFRQKKLIIVNLIKIFSIFLDCTWNIQNLLCILNIKFKKFPLILQILSAIGIRGISEKLRKLRIKSRKKTWSLFFRAETNF